MSSVHEQERSLQRRIAQEVEAALPDVEVLAVELTGRERFTVFIDRVGGSVDHALCARVTDVLRGYLREYSVDVSSPGFERPLRKPAHFRNVLGRRVSIRTAADISGRRRFRGELVAANEGAVTVQTTEQAYDIPYDTIVRGNLIDQEGGR